MSARTYVPLEAMNAADIASNVARLRKKGDLKQADALEAYWRAKVASHGLEPTREMFERERLRIAEPEGHA